MAKRKLSPQQRFTIRKDIRQFIAQKRIQADILRAIAAKYGITTITARWYFKSVVRPSKFSTRTPKSTRKYGARKSHRGTRIQPTNGVSLRLVHKLQSVAEKSLKRALEVKKLIPRWQVYVKKEASLRQIESRLRQELRAISSKASALHRRIQSLTPR